jgi:hypothetical protein
MGYLGNFSTLRSFVPASFALSGMSLLDPSIDLNYNLSMKSDKVTA